MKTAYPILFVDDDPLQHEIMQEYLQTYTVEYVFSGENALSKLKQKSFEIVVTDIEMPGMSGIELCRMAVNDYGADVIVMTGNNHEYAYDQIIAQGARDFIPKPFKMKEFILRLKRVIYERDLLKERNRAEEELKKVIHQQTEIIKQIIQAMSFTIEIRDPYTAGHQARVAELACAIAAEMGFAEDRIQQIKLAGIIHDLGKIAVPAEILCKPGRLDKNEFGLIKEHPQVALSILNKIDFNWPIAQIIYQHHEKMDGSGYPQGLRDDEILIEARIIAVADVVEAIASHRPYRPSLGIDKALAEITENKGRAYDAAVVTACVDMITLGRFVLGT